MSPAIIDPKKKRERSTNKVFIMVLTIRYKKRTAFVLSRLLNTQNVPGFSNAAHFWVRSNIWITHTTYSVS